MNITASALVYYVIHPEAAYIRTKYTIPISRERLWPLFFFSKIELQVNFKTHTATRESPGALQIVWMYVSMYSPE